MDSFQNQPQPSLRNILAKQFADLEKSGAIAGMPRMAPAPLPSPQKQAPAPDPSILTPGMQMPQMGGSGMSPGGMADLLKMMPNQQPMPQQQPGLVQGMVPGQFSLGNPQYGG